MLFISGRSIYILNLKVFMNFRSTYTLLPPGFRLIRLLTSSIDISSNYDIVLRSSGVSKSSYFPVYLLLFIFKLGIPWKQETNTGCGGVLKRTGYVDT